ncbi:TetR family transcriptional regulator C-terminal domain-containing protein, partial [Methylorubrum podarium]|uniref:TetR family transcriptional regulator C-terminal domain-containing protein n=1 Tax=Methylorubrum podarium TaxID=200476 RepID=UPI001EE25742
LLVAALHHRPDIGIAGRLRPDVEAQDRRLAGDVVEETVWAESTRNPDIGAMVERGDEEGRTWLIAMFDAIKTSPDCDPAALFDAVAPLMKGMIVSRALNADYDAGPAVAQLQAAIDAGLSGTLPLAPLAQETGR